MTNSIYELMMLLKEARKDFFTGKLTADEQQILAFDLADMESKLADYLISIDQNLSEIQNQEFGEKLDQLILDLQPAAKFFNEPNQVETKKKRMSKKEKERLEFEEYEKRLELKALNEVMNGGKK